MYVCMFYVASENYAYVMKFVFHVSCECHVSIMCMSCEFHVTNVYLVSPVNVYQVGGMILIHMYVQIHVCSTVCYMYFKCS